MFDVYQILFAVNRKYHEDTRHLEPSQNWAWNINTYVYAFALNLVLFITTKLMCSEFNLDI